MRHSAAAVLVLATLVAGTPSRAQSTTEMAFELRPFAGMFIPTGPMRRDFSTGTLFGLQGGFELNSHTHLILGGAWVHSNARFPTFTVKRTDIWQFDAGAEANLVTPLGRDWLFRPFVGGGAGIRTYDYESPGVGSRTCVASYGSLGAEAQRFVGAIRFEARNNVTCYASPLTGLRKVRHDVGLHLGFVYHMM